MPSPTNMFCDVFLHVYIPIFRDNVACQRTDAYSKEVQTKIQKIYEF